MEEQGDENMSYLLCFDIDGTIRDNVNHEVSESTLKTLRLLKENGYKMIVSSGRGYDSLKRTNVRELIHWDGYVLNNGQLVLDGDENVLFEAHLSEKTIRETLKLADEYACNVKSSNLISVTVLGTKTYAYPFCGSIDKDSFNSEEDSANDV